MTPYYDHAGVTIYHGDCRNILPHLEPVDLVLTDPPYNCKKDYGTYKDDLPLEGYQAFMIEVAKLSRILSVNQFWIAPRYQMLFFLTLFYDAHLIVIRRGARGPLRDGGWTDQFEIALAVGKPSSHDYDLWEGIRLKGEGYYFHEETYGHPGYTPIKIMEKAIKLLSVDSICDPFCGTGTALVAAKQLGRKAIGIEIEEKYCEIAVKRLAQEVLPL
jgi:site-specific DNA-methyltransferase (adenine-specific)